MGQAMPPVAADAGSIYAEGSFSDRASIIHSHATYVATLVDVVNDAMRRFQQGLERSHGGGIAEYGDWKQIRTLLHLAESQADLIVQQALAIEDMAWTTYTARCEEERAGPY